jgi:hypothetical protein
MPFGQLDPDILQLLGPLGLGGFEQILLSPLFRAQLMTQLGGQALQTMGSLAPGLMGSVPGTQNVSFAGTGVPVSAQALLALLMGMDRGAVGSLSEPALPPGPAQFEVRPAAPGSIRLG